MDELKKYLQQHANRLDEDEPGAHVWQQIRQRTSTARKTPVVLMVTRWAAAACVLVLAGVGTWHLLYNHKNPAAGPLAKTEQTDTPHTAGPSTTEPAVAAPVTAANTPSKSASAAPYTRESAKPGKKHNTPLPQETQDLTTLYNIESSFTQVINLQRRKLSNTPLYAESPAYFSDFKTQLSQMEKDEKQIKADIVKRGMSDELLDQLINLYQQKLNTLKQLQTEMNKLNNRFKKTRGPIDSTSTYFLNI